MSSLLSFISVTEASLPIFRPTAPVTAVGPMATQFTASSDCLEDLHVQSVIGDDDSYATTFIARKGLDFAKVPRCLPPGYAEAALTTNAVMSPAYQCPQSYSAQCTMVGISAAVQFKDDVYIWQALQPSQVAIGCCPDGFGCVQSAPYECASYPKNDNHLTLYASDRNGDDLTSTQRVGYRDQVTATATRLIYVQATIKQDTALNDYVKIDGLSPGYIAAIAVPVVFVVLLAAGLSIWACKRRKKSDVQQGYADDHIPEKKEAKATEGVATRSSRRKSRMKNASTQTGPHRPGSSHSAPEWPGAITKAAEEGLYIPKNSRSKSKGKQKATEEGIRNADGGNDPAVMSGALSLEAASND